MVETCRLLDTGKNRGHNSYNLGLSPGTLSRYEILKNDRVLAQRDLLVLNPDAMSAIMLDLVGCAVLSFE